MPSKAILKILNGKYAGEEFIFDFNPAEYTVETGNRFQVVNFPELSSPLLQFVSGEGESLSFEFLLDDTLRPGPGSKDPLWKRLSQLEKALAVDPSLHAPPLVSFLWGREVLPKAVVEKLSKRFVLFNEQGWPVRVRLSLTLRRYISPEEQKEARSPESTDVSKVHLLKEGENLFLIAYQEYEDVSAWRLIARENGLRDPLSVPVGTLLKLPPRRKGRE